MNDYRTFLESSSSHWAFLVAVWALPLVFVVVGLWLLRPWWERRATEKQMQECIRRLGKNALSDVSVDNGMDSFAFIDFLVLTASEILVITRQRGRGAVFGGEKIDLWAQVLGRRTYRFPNPLVTSAERVMAVRYHLPKTPVKGVVLFEDGVEFPKGRPEGILLPAEIHAKALQWETVRIPEPLQAAWDKLVELSTHGAKAYVRELQALRGRKSHVREAVAVSLLIVAALIEVWNGWCLLITG